MKESVQQAQESVEEVKGDMQKMGDEVKESDKKRKEEVDQLKERIKVLETRINDQAQQVCLCASRNRPCACLLLVLLRVTTFCCVSARRFGRQAALAHPCAHLADRTLHARAHSVFYAAAPAAGRAANVLAVYRQPPPTPHPVRSPRSPNSAYARAHSVSTAAASPAAGRSAEPEAVPSPECPGPRY